MPAPLSSLQSIQC